MDHSEAGTQQRPALEVRPGTDTRDIYKTLDLCLRIGEVLLSSGAGAADVAATMLSLAHAVGLRGVDVDVTFTALSMSYQSSFEEPPLMQVRNVRHRDIDYNDLTSVDHLVRAVIRGDVDRDEARNRLAQVVSSGHPLPRWAVTLGWGFTGLGVGMLLGGDWIVVLIAFCAAAGINLLQREISRRRLPAFYQQVAGGLLATLLATAVAATRVPVDPSLVVTASIVMLLSGLGFMGAIQDALTGYYITSGARLLEVMLATAGIIAGVSGGLTVAQLLEVPIALEPGAAALSDLPVMCFGAALCSAAFAFSAYSPRRSLFPIGLIGAAGEALFYLTGTQGLGRAWGTALAAVAIGVISYSVAGRVRVPPLVVVVSAIVPLLPGLSIYRALSLTVAGDASGVLALATAGGVAIALASGVILGEYIAQPLKREARRLEDRLAGPRLVGPLRARSVRRRR
ncbi:MAG TPA: threonine/serine exporter family protein [Nocardioidaceae bacterium]|nr:threonine/serine exporter family protein [Nocardioidaceae bacterium]